MSSVGIIDYGIGNIASVQNALEHIGVASVVITDAAEIASAEKLILPGVGAYAIAMENLRERGLIDALNTFVLTDQKPLLGLCLGMQLLFGSSEEFGTHPGLGWIPGKVLSLTDARIDLPIPHMGWNDLVFQNPSPLLEGMTEQASDVYFVHSYYCNAENRSDVSATVQYGVEMDVMVRRGNIFGCQFHPEKSQQNGLQILQNFCSL